VKALAPKLSRMACAASGPTTIRPWLLWRRPGPALVGHRSRLCGKARCLFVNNGMSADDCRCESVRSGAVRAKCCGLPMPPTTANKIVTTIRRALLVLGLNTGTGGWRPPPCIEQAIPSRLAALA